MPSTPLTRFRLPTGLRLFHAGLNAWTALVFLFLYAPIVVLAVYSFNRSRLNVVWQGFTLDWYGRVLDNAPLLRAAQNSFFIGLATAAISVVLGTGTAWLLHRHRFRGHGAIQTLAAIPMVMPEILIGVSLLVFFAAAKYALGFTTVVIGHVTFSFPFVLVAVQARLRGLDPALEEAALDLGATPAQAFWRVIVPWLGPAIAAGALMAFTLSWDELIVSFFTANAASATLPMRIFGLAKVGLNPMLNALSALVVLVTTALLLFTAYLRRLEKT